MAAKAKPHSDSQLYKLLLERVKPYWVRLAFAMGLMLIVAATNGALAFIVKNVVNDILVKPDPMMMYLVPIGIVGIYIFKGMAGYGQNVIMQWVGQRIITQYRIDLYAHLQRLSMGYYDRTPTGELMSRITNDVNMIQGSVSSVVTGVLRDVFTVFALMGVVVYRDWFLSIFALGVFPLVVIPIVKLGRRLRKISTSSQETMADVSVLLHETISGARIVKGFCREEYEAERFAKHAWRLFMLRVKDVSTRAISHPLMEFLGGVAMAGIMIYGGHRIQSGAITPGDLMSFLAALMMLYEPVKKISSLNMEIQNGLAAATRVYKLLDEPVEVVEQPGARELQPPRDKIEFKGVSFAYQPGGDMVLKDIDLTVPVGQVLALVGTSGGGKTTMVNLLPRFYEVNHGAILFDGLDIREVTLHSLRSQISIVTQQTILFNDTVQANICYGRPDATEDEVRAAAEAAYALEFIQQMPQGFDTMIGEGGVLLSGGQRQRLSIARALLADRPVLILDEATSSLDTESELFVQKALENLMKGRTTFVIAHRLSTVQRADRILVVSDGRIVEDGRHEELVAKGGVYHRLHNMQFDVDRGLEVD
jgi:ATP-binding cassette, subfamily B, bacterial MsbA